MVVFCFSNGLHLRDFMKEPLYDLKGGQRAFESAKAKVLVQLLESLNRRSVEADDSLFRASKLFNFSHWPNKLGNKPGTEQGNQRLSFVALFTS